MNHRAIKLLLTLIAVALWGILLRLIFIPTPAIAQASPTQVQYQFSFIRDTTDVKASLNAMKDALNQDAAKGWRAKSIALQSDSGLMVILQEK
jgi:hypothetical protein